MTYSERKFSEELMYVAVFQVDAFRGLEKGHIKLNTNVSFYFKKKKKKENTTNVTSKVKCNMISLIFVF